MFKGIGQLKVHALARGGMFEGDGLRLEIETVGLCAIEFIAQDGTAKAIGVGTMHPQLVGPARMGP